MGRSSRRWFSRTHEHIQQTTFSSQVEQKQLHASGRGVLKEALFVGISCMSRISIIETFLKITEIHEISRIHEIEEDLSFCVETG